jgi:hypothetical protein
VSRFRNLSHTIWHCKYGSKMDISKHDDWDLLAKELLHSFRIIYFQLSKKYIYVCDRTHYRYLVLKGLAVELL